MEEVLIFGVFNEMIDTAKSIAYEERIKSYIKSKKYGITNILGDNEIDRSDETLMDILDNYHILYKFKREPPIYKLTIESDQLEYIKEEIEQAKKDLIANTRPDRFGGDTFIFELEAIKNGGVFGKLNLLILKDNYISEYTLYEYINELEDGVNLELYILDKAFIVH